MAAREAADGPAADDRREGRAVAPCAGGGESAGPGAEGGEVGEEEGPDPAHRLGVAQAARPLEPRHLRAAPRLRAEGVRWVAACAGLAQPLRARALLSTRT